jgi:hypothetical protein
MNSKALFFSSILSAILFIGTTGLASPKPLFQKGPESFRIIDSTSSKTPEFHVLSDSVTKKSLAIAVNSAWKLGKPGDSFVNLRIEKIRLQPAAKDTGKIELILQISGHEVPLDASIRKEDLTSGKRIQIKLPNQEDQLAVFTVSSKANFILQYDRTQDVLIIDQASAHFEIENPMSESESENIHFNGRGIRL